MSILLGPNSQCMLGHFVWSPFWLYSLPLRHSSGSTESCYPQFSNYYCWNHYRMHRCVHFHIFSILVLAFQLHLPACANGMISPLVWLVEHQPNSRPLAGHVRMTSSFHYRSHSKTEKATKQTREIFRVAETGRGWIIWWRWTTAKKTKIENSKIYINILFWMSSDCLGIVNMAPLSWPYSVLWLQKWSADSCLPNHCHFVSSRTGHIHSDIGVIIACVVVLTAAVGQQEASEEETHQSPYFYSIRSRH